MVEGIPVVSLRKIDRGPDRKPSWLPAEILADGSGPYDLCRCGTTAAQPFCDKASRECFAGPTELVPAPPPVSWEVEGLEAPALALKPNGPIRVLGPVRIELPDGATCEPLRCSLCRCGHSETMPFCDGSHKEVGFRDRD